MYDVTFAEIVPSLLIPLVSYIAYQIRLVVKNTKENSRVLFGEDGNPHAQGLLGVVDENQERIENLEENYE